MKRKGGKMKKGFILCLFFLGYASVVLLIVYLFFGFLFVFSDVKYPGLIAWVPKWFFLFSPLVFLGKTEVVKETIICLFDKLN